MSDQKNLSSAPSSLSLDNTYLQLFADGRATPVEVDDQFWSEIHRREHLHEGRMMGLIALGEDGTHSEMHPEGDEILILLSGSVDIVFQEDGRERAVTLTARRACVVPQGAWHYFRVHEPGELMFITPGRGTSMREVSQQAPQSAGA